MQMQPQCDVDREASSTNREYAISPGIRELSAAYHEVRCIYVLCALNRNPCFFSLEHECMSLGQVFILLYISVQKLNESVHCRCPRNTFSNGKKKKRKKKQ